VNELISVCIPTYNRLELLQEALESVRIQHYRPLEIVIRDDSTRDDTEQWLRSLPAEPGLTISYVRNETRRGQNRNVNDLFASASAEWLVLLHDDDKLLPGAIDTLVACRRRMPDLKIAFGKVEIISNEGHVLPAETRRANKLYSRTSDRAGELNSALEAGLMQMLPSNGYLVRTDVARKVGYRSEDEVGPSCDLDFALRLGMQYDRHSAYFVDAFVSQYRYSAVAISNDSELARVAQPLGGLTMFRFANSLRNDPAFPKEFEPALDGLLRRLSYKAFKAMALVEGDRKAASELYFSHLYPWRQRLTPTGLYQLGLLASPRLFRIRQVRTRPRV
jgi:glycosyltransferase involved in cell wall biosynthesis